MNFADAWGQMLQLGRKVRRPSWDGDRFWLVKGKDLYESIGGKETFKQKVNTEDTFANDFEVVE
jgi:hypothetical protein